MLIIPDLNWCAEISKSKGVSVRCPFATVKSCPRYYQSLSLLGEAGSTKIPPEEDARLLKYWQSSDLWPRTGEYSTSISGPSGQPHQFSEFCPEVAFNRFGYFACYLARYSDEIDTDRAHHRLEKEHTAQNDWRWAWASLREQHYTECDIYSVLDYRSRPGDSASLPDPLPWWRKHIIELIVGLIVTVIGGLLLKLFV
jgi:hypothetical protein